MSEPTVEHKEQKTVKRFTSSEEFLKEYYPQSIEQEAQRKTQSEGEFGTELASESLSRHAIILHLRGA